MGTESTIDAFYERLLRLDSEDPEPLLEEALVLIVELTGAELALLEIYGADGTPQLSRGHHAKRVDPETLRGSISRRIIERAMAERRTVTTTCALNDNRFADLSSVRQHEIQAVICAPIGTENPLGVIYVQGATGSFGKLERTRIETFALAIVKLAEQLAQADAPRPTLREQMQAFKELRVQEAMERHGGNLSKAARELGVTRPLLYRARRRPKP